MRTSHDYTAALRNAPGRGAAGPARSIVRVSGAVLGLVLGTGCATLPDSGVTTTVGPISDQWAIQWNDALGTPARMTNRSTQDIPLERGTPPLSEAQATTAALSVVRDNANWFRLQPGVNDLEVAWTRPSEWLRVVRLQQRYRGVPVLGGGYEARVFPNGRVGSMEGRFEPDLSLSVIPGVGEDQAAAQARNALLNSAGWSAVAQVHYDVDRVLPASQALAILPAAGGPVLAWAVMIEPTPQERWRVYIDAQSNAVLGRELVSGGWVR